ncbi:MAG: SEC-C domain-containing protein [Chloroflexaceae bacterium]|nr:SEC-C domain-containing protein [Chloroflexaceae bacterium]
MAKPEKNKQKQKIGRNDPCWCGSGKKYKDCHYAPDQAQRAEQLRLSEAEDTLIPKIFDAAHQVPAAFPAAMEQFWKGKYGPEQMGELDDLENRGSDRFLTWFAFDYGLPSEEREGEGEKERNGETEPSAAGRMTLVERLSQAAEQGTFEVDAYEARLLRAWVGVRMRPYVVECLYKGKGLLVRDLLDHQPYEVKDYGAPKRLKEGEVLVGHLIPVGVRDAGVPPSNGVFPDAPVPLYSLAGAIAQLTADTQEKLREFAGLHLQDLRRTKPDATWDDLMRQRSAVLNHFVMALPVEEYNPTLMDDILLEARVALRMAGQTIGTLTGQEREADEADKVDKVDARTE